MTVPIFMYTHGPLGSDGMYVFMPTFQSRVKNTLVCLIVETAGFDCDALLGATFIYLIIQHIASQLTGYVCKLFLHSCITLSYEIPQYSGD